MNIRAYHFGGRVERQFCIYCGSELSDDMVFCEECGERVDDDSVDFLGSRPQQGPEQEKTAELTLPLDISESDEASEQDQLAYIPAAMPHKVKKSLTPFVKAIITFSIVLVVAGGVVALLVFHPWSPNGEDSQENSVAEETPTTEIKESESSSSAATTATENDKKPTENNQGGSASTSKDTSLSDEEVKVALTSFYDLLDGFDGEIRASATTFNNDYLKTDMTVRKNALATAKDLKDRIDSSFTELKKLEVPKGSAYYSKFEDICILYDDLSNRIGVIIEAWEISVKYSVPSEHVSEITAPLARDNIDGKNIYLLDFQDRYPKSRP